MRVAMGLASKSGQGAGDRVLRRAVLIRLHELDADAVQFRHAALAALELLPDHGVGRPRGHLRGDQGKRAARQVRGRSRQRLDPGARPRLAHQGHQRQVAGRGALPQGGERHRGRGEPGRQAQGRGVLLPRGVAPRHRGVSRAAQEHRRRPPAHARHEHRELDPGPVHEARDGGEWTLFSPSDVLDHDNFGRSFEEAYLRYEDKAARELKLYKKVPALQLWRKMLSMLFETGHPWITFKDPCNGARSSTWAWCTARTCAEICAQHLVGRDRGVQPGLDQPGCAPCRRSLRPNWISQNKTNNFHGDADAGQRHRHQLLRCRQGEEQQPASPSGGPGHHGVPGLPAPPAHPASRRARSEFADRSMEMVAYAAYWASTELAEERGRYASFPGSLWDRGILPQDTLDILSAERGGYVELDRSARLDWERCARIKQHGMRNSNTSRSHPPPPSPTSSACRPRSSRPTRT